MLLHPKPFLLVAPLRYEFINVNSRRRKASKWSSSSKWASSFDFETSTSDPLAHGQDIFISEEYEQPIELDDSQPETKPSSENLQMFVVGKQAASSSPTGADEMYIEEDEIENVPVDTDGASDSFAQFGQLQHKRPAKRREVVAEIVLDEMDSFFLSMSKALKKLPQVEQINVRSQVYNLITRAEIDWLQKGPSTPTTPSKPIIDS